MNEHNWEMMPGLGIEDFCTKCGALRYRGRGLLLFADNVQSAVDRNYLTHEPTCADLPAAHDCDDPSHEASTGCSQYAAHMHAADTELLKCRAVTAEAKADLDAATFHLRQAELAGARESDALAAVFESKYHALHVALNHESEVTDRWYYRFKTRNE